MSNQRQRDTAPEMAIRCILHSRGYRYRVDYQIPHSRRRADLVFARRKVAVFIDGCFWHSCPVHGSVPKQNRAWWVSKLKANAERDRSTDTHLRNVGWHVVRVWEHEEPSQAADRIVAVLETL